MTECAENKKQKQELINKINLLSLEDIQRVKIFLAGMDAGREAEREKLEVTEKG